LNQKIFVIDDEEDILELVKYNLEHEGFEVGCFTTGEQALTAIHEAVPDLILLDLMLPGINGIDVLKRLKADVRTRMVPVIMISARSEEADIVAGFESGIDDYVTKPFSPKRLLDSIKRVLKL